LLGCTPAEPVKPLPAKPATDAGESTQAEATSEAGFDVGNLAPDIEGQDLDGVQFKLSDYRGKVVVLDFWGDW
jgi:cytochrome oxidase Cu insertion factor (SCO1/SenC/PrrC family)